MRVDRSGAVEIAERASEFDWTWTLPDIADLTVLLGWGAPATVAAQAGCGESWTGLDVDHPVARFCGEDGRLDYIVVTVASVAAGPSGDRDIRSALAAAFHEVSIGLWKRWGEPTGVQVSTKLGVCWTFPTLGVGLAVGRTTVELWLIAPAEQQRVAEIERSRAAIFTASVEWIAYAGAISVLVQADPGSWSRADLDQVFADLGWPVHIDSWVHDTVTAAAGSVSLSASRTTEHQRRHRYGDYASVRLRTSLPLDVIDIAYAAALTTCARALGTPSFVAGPDARATWRRRTTTLTLSRETSQGSGALEIALTPTAAEENETAYYSEWGEDWTPDEYWRVRPDATMRQTDLEGMYYPGTRTATDWDTFDTNLAEVFVSLGQDLPVLGPYAPTITWVIMAAGVQGFTAQGWFSPTGYRVETIEDTAIAFRDYPPGRDGATQILEITRTALHAAADSPTDLRYYAFAQNPGVLRDFRLGITESRHDN